MNTNVRRIFNLEDIVEPYSYSVSGSEDDVVRFLPKEQLMAKLEQFDNLINAMGALFYASKRMTSQIPCVFNAWKDFAFEKKGQKIRDLISSGNLSLTSPIGSDHL